MGKNKLILALSMLAVLIAPSLVNAQTPQATGNGLSLTPTKNEFVIERGGSETFKISIKNVSPIDILAKAFLNDFEQDGTTGNPKIIADSNIASSSSLREFVTGVKDLSIKAGGTGVVELTLTIPENAAPGAYYGALRFTTSPLINSGTNNSQVSLNASVASLILVEVPGDILEKIEVSKVTALLSHKSGSLFTKKPDMVGIEINNLGNGFSKPFGKVSVTGPWGRGEILSYELNNVNPRGNVLPNSKRLFEDELKGVTWPGRYTIHADVSHGSGGQVLSSVSSFWYLPTWFLLVLLVIVLIVVGAGFYLYRKYVTKSTRRRR